MLRVLSIGIIAALTASCGGGGSSSGSGSFDSSAVGNYSGRLNGSLCLQGQGCTPVSLPISVQILNNGEVRSTGLTGVGSGATSCSGRPPWLLNGNSFAVNESYRCSGPAIGNCTVNQSVRGSVRNGAVSFSQSSNVVCTGGPPATFNGTANATRRSKTSLSTENAVGLSEGGSHAAMIEILTSL